MGSMYPSSPPLNSDKLVTEVTLAKEMSQSIWMLNWREKVELSKLPVKLLS